MSKSRKSHRRGHHGYDEGKNPPQRRKESEASMVLRILDELNSPRKERSCQPA
jgi:hypothetical protein